MENVFETELYSTQMKETRTKEGRQLLATTDGKCVLIYVIVAESVVKPSIVANSLKGVSLRHGETVPLLSDILYVLHATNGNLLTQKKGKRVLALWLRQDVYVSLLVAGSGHKVTDSGNDLSTDPEFNRGSICEDVPAGKVALRWMDYIDPVRHIDEWEALVIDIDNTALVDINERGVMRVDDVTQFLTLCHRLEHDDKINEIQLPVQRQFVLEDPDLNQTLLIIDDIEDSMESWLNFGCLSEALSSVKPKTMEEVYACRDVVINLFGAFNPIHTRHVAAIVNTKQFLEENNNFNVVGGYISVCSDETLKSKFKGLKEKTLTIKSSHRIQLCRLAVKEHSWITVLEKPIHYIKCAKTILTRQKKQVRIANVFGSDRAFISNGQGRWTLHDAEVTVVVLREGQRDQHAKEKYEQDLRSRVILKRDFFFLPMASDNISSTSIRTYLKQIKTARDKAEKLRLVDELVGKGWIVKEEGDYILKEKKIYFT